MHILEILFPVKCAECGQKIKGEKLPALGPGWMCQVCNIRIKEELDRKYKEANREAIQRVIDRIKKDFPPEDFDKILTLLAEYGKEKSEVGHEFIHLAILRLANGDRKKLPELIRVAKEDFRDVLYAVQCQYGLQWAEEFVNE